MTSTIITPVGPTALVYVTDITIPIVFGIRWGLGGANTKRLANVGWERTEDRRQPSRVRW